MEWGDGEVGTTDMDREYALKEEDIRMLHNKAKEDLKFNIFMGFDGFVDKILKPVRMKDRDNTDFFQTIKEFADYLAAKEGKSCSVALEKVQEKIGGNMPIMANALGTLGCKPVCVGTMGFPEVLPIFRQMSGNCSLISVGNPGYSDALEFISGKLMLGENGDIDALDYRRLISAVPEEELIRYLEECDGAAFLNWGELIGSNDIWENILTRILPKCEFKGRKKMLMDFSDFSKRQKEEVEKLTELIRGYAQYFDIAVSLNENELEQFSEKLGFGEMSMEEKLLTLSKRFSCSEMVLHLLGASCYVKGDEILSIEKEIVKNPRTITGGGDNFNAGLLLGLLLEMDMEGAIRLGAGLSSLYVKCGREVTWEELAEYSFGS